MEIPVITRMTEFEATIVSLSNSSLISRLLSIFELEKLSNAHKLWKWGAFLLAFYACSKIANKIRILILYYHNKSKLLLSSEPLLYEFDDDFSSEEDEEDDVVRQSSSSSDDNDDEAEEPTSSYEDLNRFEDDFMVKGSFGNFNETPGQKRKFKLRRRRSTAGNFFLSDLVNGNGVVKLWDNGFGLGVDVNNSSITTNDEGIIMSFPAVSMSPAVIISAGSGEVGKLGLSLWDLRTGRKSPAVYAEWRSDRLGRVVGIDSGRTGKVYVIDDVSSKRMIGDVRKMDTPFENSTEDEKETWWDADGVSVTDES